MIKDFVLLLMVISGIAGVFSPLFFREGGVIWGMTTRKAIIIEAICIELMLFLGMIAMLIDNPSNFLTAIACIGGGTIVTSIYFNVIYLRFPHAREKHLRGLRERQKFLNLIREKRENQRKEKDDNEE